MLGCLLILLSCQSGSGQFLWLNEKALWCRNFYFFKECYCTLWKLCISSLLHYDATQLSQSTNYKPHFLLFCHLVPLINRWFVNTETRVSWTYLIDTAYKDGTPLISMEVAAKVHMPKKPQLTLSTCCSFGPLSMLSRLQCQRLS